VAVGFMAGGAATIALILVVVQADFSLSDDALSAIAQIGATLLIAYALETSWFVKESRARGSKRENWLGFVTGIGICSALGVVIAIAFIGYEGTLSFLQAFAAVWMLFSLGFLALLVALLPYVLYEWVHTVHTEYPDE
jgi:cytochrome bd-type quinol oxidase subunit 2